jgi:hypothetical protein
VLKKSASSRAVLEGVFTAPGAAMTAVPKKSVAMTVVTFIFTDCWRKLTVGRRTVLKVFEGE